MGYIKRDVRLLIGGWLVVASGTFSVSSRGVYNVFFAEDTELQLFAGGGIRANIPVGLLLQKIEMDSLMASENSNIIESLPIAEVMRFYHEDPQKIGNLILRAKIFADRLLGAEVGRENVFVTYGQVPELSSLNQQENKIVQNYLRLRNIKFIESTR